ncbi:nucleotidyltransferase domain-containing protein [Variovorax paradoxus]|nr:nucleotidyltransferase domain-containing protein [Variovorax paradoxus]MBT2301055.1 nucleotidyltransferase domain-containing protein [Variovorax paradoxus]
MTGIAEYLLGQTRSRVLADLFLHPEKALHVRELARLTGASAGSLHRELRGLSDAGLLRRSEVGRQVHYQANAQSPVFNELAGLLRKTAGVADVLRDALSPLGESVSLAFVYGSMASGAESPRSDVDVMVLGSAGFADVALALTEAQATLGREVNPTPMSVADFARKLKEGQGFAVNVAAGPKIWLKGEENDFAELVEHRKAQGARRHRT